MAERQIVRIGDLADALGVERSVIRFWEKEFGIRTKRSDGGQRYYSDKDVRTFEAIKELLYSHGFTISGAKKHLKDNKIKSPPEKNEAPAITVEPATHAPETEEQKTAEASLQKEFPEHLSQQIATLQKKLLRLRELL